MTVDGDSGAGPPAARPTLSDVLSSPELRRLEEESERTADTTYSFASSVSFLGLGLLLVWVLAVGPPRTTSYRDLVAIGCTVLVVLLGTWMLLLSVRLLLERRRLPALEAAAVSAAREAAAREVGVHYGVSGLDPDLVPLEPGCPVDVTVSRDGAVLPAQLVWLSLDSPLVLRHVGPEL